MSTQFGSSRYFLEEKGFLAIGTLHHVGYLKECQNRREIILAPKPPEQPMTLASPRRTFRIYAHAEYALWIFCTVRGLPFKGMDQINLRKPVDIWFGERHAQVPLGDAIELVNNALQAEVRS